MAYPSIKQAYGLVPSNLIGGQVFSGSTRMFPINSATLAMYNGDLLKINPDGTIAPSGLVVPAGTGAAQPVAGNGYIGVFQGSEYSTTGGPLFGKMRNNFWSTAFNTAQDAIGYVTHDPDTVFKVAVLAQASGSGTQSSTPTQGVGYMSPAFVGSNVYYVSGTPSITAGNSGAGVSGAQPATGVAGNVRIVSANSAALRVMDVVSETAVTVQTTVTAGSGTTGLTVASAAGIQPGMQIIVAGVTGAGTPSANTTVTAVSGTTVTVSAAITFTSGAAVTFVGYPEVLVKINFGYHNYYNALGAV